MEDNKPKENKMEIEISKYKDLVDALGDPVRVARMVLLIAAVAAILAAGIVAVVCGIKRFYPYKSINSNPYGATIIQDEDNEIIYWLFNSADLWANSGIEVKEGDVISVRTSGAYHTAIHHLVEDANNNTKIRNPWSHSKGDSPSTDSPLYERSKARAKFRIAPDLSQNTILMQVIPSKVGEKDNEFDWRTDTSNACYIDGKRHVLNKVNDHYKSGLKTEQKEPDIYEIGIGKENIRIRTNGILHFAVNDIALTPRVIDSMKKKPNYIETLDLKEVEGVWYALTNNSFNSLFTKEGLDIINPIKQIKKSNSADTLRKDNICSRCFAWLKDNKKEDTIRRDTISSEELNLNHFKSIGLIDEYGHPIKDYWNTTSPNYKKLVDKNGYLIDSIWKSDSCLINLQLLDTIWYLNELEYYQYNNFVDAWFVDNIGSFMIVIERKKVK